MLNTGSMNVNECGRIHTSRYVQVCSENVLHTTTHVRFYSYLLMCEIFRRLIFLQNVYPF